MNLQFVSMPLATRLLLAACLFVPAMASAQTAPAMAIWPSEYRSLSSMAGGADTNLVLKEGTADNGNSGVVNNVRLPFSFSLLGDGPHTSFNVGSRGYIAFGTGGDFTANRANSEEFTRSVPAWNVIAAWWGRHFCTPNGGVRTKTLGVSPNQTFIVEWSDCSKLDTGTSQGTDVKFETQIWLFEGSNVVRVHYGNVSPDLTSKWHQLAWGVKGRSNGFMGPGIDGQRNFCVPRVEGLGQVACQGTDFPKQSVIQYGLSNAVDLTARVKPGTLTVTPTTFQLTADTTLMNVGSPATSGVGYELHLSTSVTPDAGATFPVYTRGPTVNLAGGEAVTLVDEIVADRPPNGTYRLCALVNPGNNPHEADRSNNWVCSHQSVAFGPDLAVNEVAKSGQPGKGKPGEPVIVPVTISNIGNDPAGTFDYRLVLVPADGSHSSAEEVILVDSLVGGLAAGETRTLSLTARLPKIAREEKYNFRLELDPSALLNESNRLNNSSLSTATMIMERPQLSITRSAPAAQVTLPDGCFFGEEIRATFQVCNKGLSEARDFVPGVIMGDSTQIGLADDVPAASFPQFCGAPGTLNYTACGPIGSLGAVCAFEYCRAECETNAQCGAGRICAPDEYLSDFLGREAKGCMTRLNYGIPQSETCQTYTMKGKIPLQDQNGNTYVDSLQYFHVIGDARHTTSEPLPDSFPVPNDSMRCRPALLDLAVASIKPATRLVAGKDVAISRLIRNEGFINTPPGSVTKPDFENFTYRYYLGPTRDISVNQIPLKIRGAPNGTGSATITRKGTNLGTDVVEIPADIRPGEYFLGLILDPGNNLIELEKFNNLLVYPEPIFVEPQALTIITDLLPKTNQGAQFSFTFVAMSGLGAYVWSADNLPPGMAMAPNGVLQGRPTEPGNFAFTVRVSSGGAINERLMALQVLPGQSELEVATKTLPIAVKGAPYGRWFDAATSTYNEGVKLAASGGQPPYTWELDPFELENRMPEGLEDPTPEGVIKGQATLMSETSRFLVRVRDSLGNENKAWLEIAVVDVGTLVIPASSYPQARSGTLYGQSIEAQGGDGTYHWTVDEDSLPAGLVLEPEGAKAWLRGVPTVCGNFTVGLQVSDGQAQSSTAAVALSVECGVIQLSSHAIRPVNRGEVIEFQLGAVPSDQPIFSLYRGSLPDGLALGEDGLISGTVALDASYETHDMIIELRDAVGRRSLSALTMSVVIEPPQQELVTKTRSKGCGSNSSGDSSAALSTLGLAMLGLGLMRRNSASSRIDSHEI